MTRTDALTLRGLHQAHRAACIGRLWAKGWQAREAHELEVQRTAKAIWAIVGPTWEQEGLVTAGDCERAICATAAECLGDGEAP